MSDTVRLGFGVHLAHKGVPRGAWRFRLLLRGGCVAVQLLDAFRDRCTIGTTLEFAIDDLTIGTLDGLLFAVDDLAHRHHDLCHASVMPWRRGSSQGHLARVAQVQ